MILQRKRIRRKTKKADREDQRYAAPDRDIFPVLFEFADYLDLPKYLYGETFIEYQAPEGLQMVFHYAYARGKQWKELTMKELFLDIM